MKSKKNDDPAILSRRIVRGVALLASAAVVAGCQSASERPTPVATHDGITVTQYPDGTVCANGTSEIRPGQTVSHVALEALQANAKHLPADQELVSDPNILKVTQYILKTGDGGERLPSSAVVPGSTVSIIGVCAKPDSDSGQIGLSLGSARG